MTGGVWSFLSCILAHAGPAVEMVEGLGLSRVGVWLLLVICPDLSPSFVPRFPTIPAAFCPLLQPRYILTSVVLAAL